MLKYLPHVYYQRVLTEGEGSVHLNSSLKWSFCSRSYKSCIKAVLNWLVPGGQLY
jgi:hypothetical protein